MTITEAKRYFALPDEKKMQVFTGLVPNEYVGFHPMECYNRNGWKHQDLSEAFNWAYDAQTDPEAVDKTENSVSIWPIDLPGFRDNLYAYHTELLRLSRRLTRIFALALHLPEDYFDEYVKRPEAGMRILHYPEQKHSVDEQNGIGAHTDVECFTIVTQDSSGGLEVLSKSGNWVKADPIPAFAEYITVFHASCSPAPPAAYNDSLRNWRQRICETELKGSYYDEDDQCQVVDPVTADTKKVYHPTLGAAGQPNIKTRCTWS
ncbi:hypothetical protein COL5a_001150 [Colletotrichum fioriniae]|nr:hypothetical protein COL5a_001150 [Colletotrichum fioriniae]